MVVADLVDLVDLAALVHRADSVAREVDREELIASRAAPEFRSGARFIHEWIAA